MRDEPEMSAIIYMSQETQAFSKDALGALLKTARSRNRDCGVTGYLHYESGYLLQYIEGQDRGLNETMDRIENDKRHSIFYRNKKSNLADRRFPEWDMQWFEPRRNDDQASALTELNRTLRPFERLHDVEALDRVVTIYTRIAHDCILRKFSPESTSADQLGNALAMVVHDLRAPVRNIWTLIEMYIEDEDERIDPEFLSVSNQIKSQIHQANSLIDGILDYVASNQPMLIQSVNMNEVFDEIAQSHQTPTSTTQVVSVGNLPTISGNPLNLWRVLNCLIENGLKYNLTECPRVEVSATRLDAEWRFCVKDNGIGVSPEHQQQIFLIFKRLHSQNAFPGSGVGLATCRKIVEEWGGRVWLNSTEGQGSEFFFTCPA